MQTLTPQLLLSAYAQGLFPMADSREGKTLRWYSPELRGVLPLEDFHVPKSLAKFLKKNPFRYSVNHCFREVITACAARDETWINDDIIALYCELHALGFAHSVEVWGHPSPINGQEDRLLGGLYGVALGSAFFGESMFSRAPNASKAALVELVGRLKEKGYTLLDAQYVNEHLLQFGIQEMPREEYLRCLEAALARHGLPFAD
jgi:leucyl/phenylalanyl-tRNA--protein transferase